MFDRALLSLNVLAQQYLAHTSDNLGAHRILAMLVRNKPKSNIGRSSMVKKKKAGTATAIAEVWSQPTQMSTTAGILPASVYQVDTNIYSRPTSETYAAGRT